MPLHTALLTVSIGAVNDGALNVTTCAGHPATVVVMVILLPVAMPVMAVAVTVPVEAVIVAPFGLTMFTL